MPQLDRTVLRKIIEIAGHDRYQIDALLIESTNEQLHHALACLEEMEFYDLRSLNLKPKIEAILRHRGVLESQQVNQRGAYRWRVTTAIAIIGLIVAVARCCSVR